MSVLSPRKETHRDKVIDNYHGTMVADPYRWLEDDTCPTVKEWIGEQNGDFESYISGYDIRNVIKSRLTALWNYPKSSVPHVVEGVYYTWRNDGLQNQNILYRSPCPKEQGETVLDPNQFSEDGTIAVTSISFSPKGTYMAYSLSSSGSDWQTLHILDLKSMENLTETLHHVKFTTPTWLPDESSFFYSRFPDPKAETVLTAQATNMMVCLHTLGQNQSEDRIVHKDDEHPDWNFYFHTDEDKKWVFLHIWYGTLRRNKLFFRPLENLDAPWLPIADDFENGWDVIGVVNNTAFIETQKDAPFGKVMSVKLTPTGAVDWQTVIPDTGKMLEGIILVNNQLLCISLVHATHRLALHELNGKFIREIELPALGSIRNYYAKQKGKELFIQFTSFLYLDSIFRYDFEAGKLEIIFAPQIDFPFRDFETVQKFYTSKDGTQIPMFITCRKELAKDESHQTLLYGYGGFNISMTPAFTAATLTWLEKGGIYVTACLRGGSEYGEEWHRAGMLESKQNVFDDFIAAAEYLISEKYTCKGKIGIYGRSNGGLLTGACLTQRPDLYGAVAVGVPVLDMLRYHLFTAGRYWVGEYGCADDPEQFQFLYEYSPLHNVKMNTVYPPTLILTADTDDRVVPMQARKFAATLQAADGGENPIFIRIEKSAGHGMGKPISKIIEEWTDLFTFLLVNLGNN